MRKRGTAIGNFRMDGGRRWDAGKRTNQPNAPKARAKMSEGPHSLTEAVTEQQSLTDEIVRDFMGGNNAAANQARAYSDIMENIKAGKGTREAVGSLAAAARKRMIERDEEKNRFTDETPDIGKDKANRRAYPVGSGKNV
jgi:hypothetical protein